MNEQSIKIRNIVESDMFEIVELLQVVSRYKPFEREFSEIWENFNRQKNVYSVVAHLSEKIVGYGSIVLETKIRGGKMGHIEDIVTHTEYRKGGIGKAIVDALFQIAVQHGCYKVALQCKERNVSFYSNNGYELSGIGMQKFL